jgi:ATP synthase protein I
VNADLPEDPPGPRQQLGDEIDGKARRRLRARGEKPGIWFGLGMFGIVGWSIAVPTLVGVALGIWIDHRWPGPASWTLTLLFIGLGLGCLNAWRWIKREGPHVE